MAAPDDGMDVTDQMPPPPPPQLHELDPEELAAHLVEVLRGGPQISSDSLIVEVAKTFELLARSMPQNRPLAANLHARLGGQVARLGQPALQAQILVETCYNVIMGSASPESYATLEFSPEAAQTMWEGFDQVGIGGRANPRPPPSRPQVGILPAPTVNCTAVQQPVYDPRTGQPQASQIQGQGASFQVLQPAQGGSAAAGTGQNYAITQHIRDAIYGRVVLAHIVEWTQADPGSQVLVMTDRRVAIKVIRKDRIQRMEQRQGPMNEDPRKEMATMHWVTEQMRNGSPRLRGDVSRVLPLIEVLEDVNHFYQVMPCLEGDMFEMVTQHGAYTEPEAFKIIEQILGGLEVLHSLGLAHHDMSLENLMVDSQGLAVIIDLGMVVKVPQPDPAIAPPVKFTAARGWPCRCGKLLYLAPEILAADRSFDPLALDIWAVGVMLFVILTGVPPWDVATGPNDADRRYQLVRDGQLHVLLNAWQIQLSPEAVDFLHQLLNSDPSQRLTVVSARAHPWFQGRGGGN